jgi:hypothetical protein
MRRGRKSGGGFPVARCAVKVFECVERSAVHGQAVRKEGQTMEIGLFCIESKGKLVEQR